jgi:hypothetical protein
MGAAPPTAGRPNQRANVVSDPTDASYISCPVGFLPPTQALFITEPRDTNAISADDSHQGGLADCFLLSAIGEIGMVDPNDIVLGG